jgi:hypothetical protein
LGWGLITPYRDGWFLAESRGDLIPYLIATICVGVGGAILSTSFVTALLGLVVLFVPSAIVHNPVVLGVLTVVAGTIAALSFMLQMEHIAENVVAPWVVRTILQIASPTEFRKMVVTCVLYLPFGIGMGACMIGVAALGALLIA